MVPAEDGGDPFRPRSKCGDTLVSESEPGVPSLAAPEQYTDDRRPVIVGSVTHGDGSPVHHATLTLTDLSGRQLDRGWTDGDGRYRLMPPTGGTYVVICATAGTYQPHAALVAVADQTVRHDILLAGAGRLTGTVRLAGSGRGVGGVVVTLVDVRGNVTRVATTDKAGRYAFADLPEGTYTLAAGSADHQPVAVSVAVPAGAEITQDVELAGRCRLTGTVRALTTGKPIEEAAVTLIDHDGDVVASTLTGPDGVYAFDDLPEGTYTLAATGYAPRAVSVQLTSGDPVETTITLGPSTTPGDADA